MRHRLCECALQNGSSWVCGWCVIPSLTRSGGPTDGAGWAVAVSKAVPVVACALNALCSPSVLTELAAEPCWWVSDWFLHLACLRGQYYASHVHSLPPSVAEDEATLLRDCCTKLTEEVPHLAWLLASGPPEGAPAAQRPPSNIVDRATAEGVAMQWFPLRCDGIAQAAADAITHSFGCAAAAAAPGAMAPATLATSLTSESPLAPAFGLLSASKHGWLNHCAAAQAEWVWHTGVAARLSHRESLRLPASDVAESTRVSAETTRHVSAAVDVALALTSGQGGCGPDAGLGGAPGSRSPSMPVPSARVQHRAPVAGADGTDLRAPRQLHVEVGTGDARSVTAAYAATAATWFLGWVSAVANAGLNDDLVDAEGDMSEVSRAMWVRDTGRHLLLHSDVSTVLHRLDALQSVLAAPAGATAPPASADLWAHVGSHDVDTSGEDGQAGVGPRGEIPSGEPAAVSEIVGNLKSPPYVDGRVAHTTPTRQASVRRSSWTAASMRRQTTAESVASKASDTFGVEIPRGGRQSNLRVTAPKSRCSRRQANTVRRAANRSRPGEVAIVAGWCGAEEAGSVLAAQGALLRRCAWKLKARVAHASTSVRTFFQRVRAFSLSSRVAHVLSAMARGVSHLTSRRSRSLWCCVAQLLSDTLASSLPKAAYIKRDLVFCTDFQPAQLAALPRAPEWRPSDGSAGGKGAMMCTSALLKASPAVAELVSDCLAPAARVLVRLASPTRRAHFTALAQAASDALAGHILQHKLKVNALVRRLLPLVVDWARKRRRAD